MSNLTLHDTSRHHWSFPWQFLLFNIHSELSRANRKRAGQMTSNDSGLLCFSSYRRCFLSPLSFGFVKGTPPSRREGRIQLWDFDTNQWNTIVRFVFRQERKKEKKRKKGGKKEIWTRRRRCTHPPAQRCSLTYRCTVLPTTASTAVVRGGDYRRRVRQIPRPRRATRVATAPKTAMNRGWNQWAKWNENNWRRSSGVWSRRWATKLRPKRTSVLFPLL